MGATEELWARRVQCHLSRIQAVPGGYSSSRGPYHGRFRCIQVSARRLGEYISSFLRKAVRGLAIGTRALLQLGFNRGLLLAREVRAACNSMGFPPLVPAQPAQLKSPPTFERPGPPYRPTFKTTSGPAPRGFKKR